MAIVGTAVQTVLTLFEVAAFFCALAHLSKAMKKAALQSGFLKGLARSVSVLAAGIHGRLDFDHLGSHKLLVLFGLNAFVGDHQRAQTFVLFDELRVSSRPRSKLW
jgi:hypothetical protein